MAIVMRLVQRFQASKKHEFVELEKQFAELEARGILPKGERLLSLSAGTPATPSSGSASSRTLPP